MRTNAAARLQERVLSCPRSLPPMRRPQKLAAAAGIRVDPVEEILANKLNAALSRSEERDL